MRQDADRDWAGGEAMYRGQCCSCPLDCYRSLNRLPTGRNRENIGNLLNMLHDYKPGSPYRRFMSPLLGTSEEIRSAANYEFPAHPCRLQSWRESAGCKPLSGSCD
jgi:hypothetical protein